MIENPDEKHSEWYRRQRKDYTFQQVQVELSKTHQGKRSEKEKRSSDHETYRGSGVECEPDGGEMTPSELSLRNVLASCERIARSDRMVPSLSISVYAFVFFLGRRIRHPSLSLCAIFFCWVLCGMMIVLLISISRNSHTWDRDTLFWIFVVLLFNRLPGIDDLGSFDLVLSFLMALFVWEIGCAVVGPFSWVNKGPCIFANLSWVGGLIRIAWYLFDSLSQLNWSKFGP